MMRTIIFSLFALCSVAVTPTAALAEWYCMAKSPDGHVGRRLGSSKRNGAWRCT